MGKFNRLIEGEVKDGTFDPREHHRNQKPLCRPGQFEALVDRKLWSKVQQKIAGRRREGRLARTGGYPLTGILHCGVCGVRMGGSVTSHRRKDGSVQQYRNYVCCRTNHKPGLGRHVVREDKLLPILVGKLRDTYLGPKQLERLRQRLMAGVNSERRSDPNALAQLKKAIAKLDHEIAQATRNVLRATDNLDILQEELTEMRRQRDRLAKQLAALERTEAEPVERYVDRVEKGIAVLRSLREELGRAPLARLREVLRKLVTRMDVYFEEYQRAVYKRFRLIKAVAQLRLPDEFLAIAPHAVC